METDAKRWSGLSTAACVALMEQIRWPEGPQCVQCGGSNLHRIQLGCAASVLPGWYWCMDCKNEYSVLMGTRFEQSRVPIKKWFAAIAMFCLEGGELSPHRIQEELDLGYLSAWSMVQRIRLCLAYDADFCWKVAGGVARAISAAHKPEPSRFLVRKSVA